MTPPIRHDDRDDSRAARRPRATRETRDATRDSTRLFLVALAALCFSLACAQGAAAQGSKKGGQGMGESAAAEEEKGPPSNSVVRGRAVYDETGRPVRRGRVHLFAETSLAHGGGGASALTGAQGEFEFKGVAAGRYLVVVNVAGALVPSSFASGNGYGNGPVEYAKVRQHFQEIVVDGVGEAVVNVRARRGAAVSGRVTFENGDPAIGATVTVSLKPDDNARPASGAWPDARRVTDTADDRGVYRVTGLPPGEYVVSVAEPVAHGAADVARSDRGPISGGALFETFYPSQTKRREAVAVAVGAGEEKAGIDITIVERALYKLSGTVVARKGGAPVANARVSVIAKDSRLANSPYMSYLEHQSDTKTDEAGRFSLREIPDGDYLIHVSPTADVDANEVFGPVPAKPKGKPAAGAAAGGDEDEDPDAEGDYRQPLPRYAAKLHEVKVAGRDVEGVSVEMGGGGRIVGTITVEGGKELPGYTPIYAVTLDEAGAEPRDYKAAVMWRDQFAVGGVMPGKVYFYTFVSEQNENFYVKSITANGKDLLREFLQIEEGSEIKGVRVVVAEGAGKLEGRVFTAGREKTPAGGAEVVLVAADSSRWTHPGGRVYGRSNSDGNFELSAPPGDYFVFLLPEKDTNRTLAEADIRAYTADAKRVTLRAKQTAKVELLLAAPEGK